MPKWYRLNSSGSWAQLKNIYRLNSSGSWQKIKTIYRLNSSGSWAVVHSSVNVPTVTTAPVLQTQGGSTTVFTQIDTITLDRGTWDYMTADYAPTSYSLEIQSSTTGTGGWTNVATGTGTTISYSITLSDVVSSSLYFRGRVIATNENGSSVATTTPVRSNMAVSVSLNGAPVVSDTDIFVAWTIVRPTNGTYLSSQKIEVFNASTNALLYTANVPGTSASIYSHSIPTSSLPSSTLVYVKVTAVGNDSALTQASDFSANFTTPISGTVSISPSSSNRVEASTSVSAVLSGWPVGTTFTYLWRWQQASGTIVTLSTTNSANVPSASGTLINLSVTGTYLGQSKTANTADHRIHPQAPAFTLTADQALSGFSISSVTTTGGTLYFGSYSGPSSGNIPVTATATNTTISGLAAGTYTVTLSSRAVLNSINYDSYNSTSKTVTIKALSNPTSFSASDSTFADKIRFTFSGGSADDYVVYWTAGNNARPSDASNAFDFSLGATSPADWTGMTRGTQYYFFIKGRNSDGAGGWVYTSTWFPAGTPGEAGRAKLYAPGAPTGLSATTASSSQINLSWTAPTTNATQDSASGYDIFYNTSGISPSSSSTPTTTSSSTSASITGLSSSTTYYFWVRSRNADNTGTSASAWTGSVSATTQAALANPVIVSGYPKQMGARSTSAVSISATITSPATSWTVDYGTSTAYGSTISSLSSGAIATMGDYAIGTTVYYRVRAFNSSNSTFSSGITGSYTTVRKITGVTAQTFTTAPFVIWTVQAHGMTSMSTYVYKSTTSGGNTFGTGANDPILSGNTANGQQTRQTSVTPGGSGYKYYLSFLACYSGSGGGGSAFEVGLVTNTFTHPGNTQTFTVYST